MNKLEAIKLLGLGATYTKDDIKKAYKKLAKKYHPDIYKGDNAVFIKVKEAYELLLLEDDVQLPILEGTFTHVSIMKFARVTR